jgi:hypothetical protein
MSTVNPLLDLDAEALEDGEFDSRLLDAVVDHWHNSLMNAEQRDAVLAFLGVSMDRAERLRLGLSDRSLGLRIPGRRWKAGLVIRGRLEELGIFHESGHEAFRGCAVVPVVQSGRVVGFFGQRLDRGRGAVWAHGLDGGLFEATSGGGKAARTLITSSILDALGVLGALDASVGVESAFSVVAPGRARGFNAGDLHQLASYGDEVTILGDGAAKLAQRLGRLRGGVGVAGEDCDLSRTLTSASDPSRALLALLKDVIEPVDTAESASVEEAHSSAHTEPLIVLNAERDEVLVHFQRRSWRIRGAAATSNVEGDRLNVALSVSNTVTGRFHLDTIDLYAARQRSTFLDAAATELGEDRVALTAELVEVLNRAERRRDDATTVADDDTVKMSEEERLEATAWLREPDLLERLASDLASLGVVGEASNMMTCFLATISRKCERPLGVLVQSSSAGGKSTLVDAVCSLVPPEDLVSLSSMTSQALYYLGSRGLANKVLSVAEEQGASRASYALKLLLSEGRLTIASTGKDRASGRLVTRSYETPGPLALLMTTTATTIDPELENRLVVLGVNEDSIQTEAIIMAQRLGASIEGLLARRAREETRRRHANIQRLLEPLPVVIPNLATGFPTSATRHRRDHAKMLSLIAAITLLHQFQRERRSAMMAGEDVGYLVATGDDVEFGVDLARRVLSRDIENLAPQTVRLLEVVRDRAATRARLDVVQPTEVDVTRRELRELLGWSDAQVRAATDRLVALEYLVVAGGGRGRCRTYRLVDEFAPPPGTVPRTFGPVSSGTTERIARFADLGEMQGSETAPPTSYMKVGEVVGS